MKKKLYWLVESNWELSSTVQNLAQAKDLIEADFETEVGTPIRYSLTPKYLTDKEYENLPENL